MTAPLVRPALFIASDRREAEPWTACWDHPRDLPLPVHWARAGKWQGRDMIAIANGVGVQRAVAGVYSACSAAEGVSGIWSIGTGGALDPSLAVADIVVATAVTDGTRTWLARSPQGPPSRSGLVHSRPGIVRSGEEKKSLGNAGAILVEMEAAGVAGAAQDLAVPFFCIRAVSDLADETFFINFEEFLMPDGRFNVPRLIMNACAHPRKGLVELLRLQRRTSRAAKQLGAFLGKCSF